MLCKKKQEKITKCESNNKKVLYKKYINVIILKKYGEIIT